MVSTDT